MTDRQRCPDCDAPLARETDRNEHGDHPAAGYICWRLGGPCRRPPVDWRARALAAEAEVERLVLVEALDLRIISDLGDHNRSLADEATLRRC